MQQWDTKGREQLTWGMMVRFWRRSWRPIVAISTSSMRIVPPAASSTRKRQLVREDFPAPVRPTTPTCESSCLGQLTGFKETGQMLSTLVWWAFLPYTSNRHLPDCVLWSLPHSPSLRSHIPSPSLPRQQSKTKRTGTTLTQCYSGRRVVRAEAERASPSQCSQYCR